MTPAPALDLTTSLRGDFDQRGTTNPRGPETCLFEGSKNTFHSVNLDNGHEKHEMGIPFHDALTCHVLSCNPTVTPLQPRNAETQQIGRTFRQKPETQQFGRRFRRIRSLKWGGGGVAPLVGGLPPTLFLPWGSLGGGGGQQKPSPLLAGPQGGQPKASTLALWWLKFGLAGYTGVSTRGVAQGGRGSAQGGRGSAQGKGGGSAQGGAGRHSTVGEGAVHRGLWLSSSSNAWVIPQKFGQQMMAGKKAIRGGQRHRQGTEAQEGGAHRGSPQTNTEEHGPWGQTCSTAMLKYVIPSCVP